MATHVFRGPHDLMSIILLRHAGYRAAFMSIKGNTKSDGEMIPMLAEHLF